MKRNLMRTGNGWAIFIPKTILRLIDINPEEDQIELEIENKVLKVKKAIAIEK